MYHSCLTLIPSLTHVFIISSVFCFVFYIFLMVFPLQLRSALMILNTVFFSVNVWFWCIKQQMLCKMHRFQFQNRTKSLFDCLIRSLQCNVLSFLFVSSIEINVLLNSDFFYTDKIQQTTCPGHHCRQKHTYRPATSSLFSDLESGRLAAVLETAWRKCGCVFSCATFHLELYSQACSLYLKKNKNT